MNPFNILNWKLLIATLVSVVISSCAQLKEVERNPPPVHTIAFKRQMELVGKTKTRDGNSCQFLKNGSAFFPSMLADIRSAKESVTFETFIIREGRIANYFVNALSERSRQGVKVHMILDAIGSRFLDQNAIEKLESSGVELYWYKSVYRNPLVANNRDHRKSLIIDGKIAHVGGAGVATAWDGNGNSFWNWRDNQYRVTGPAVADLQRVFCLNWKELTGTDLSGSRYFPQLRSSGDKTIQVLASGNESNDHAIGRAYLLAVNAARKDITIGNAYVCPPERFLLAIERALKRGVRVRVLGPGKIMDSKMLQRCAHNVWKRLIPKGLEVYEYSPAMYHTKLMIVDHHLVIAGASNLDYRSFFINDENNIHIFDTQFAKKQMRSFEDDLKKSKLLTLDSLSSYSWRAWMVQSQL